MTSPKSLKKILEERISLPFKETSKYTNFYKTKSGRVALQLHPNHHGVDLAIPKGDEEIPPCKLLKQVDIKSLHGYWGPNKDWLEGNGKRFTERPAVAFHLPEDMRDKDDSHYYWQDFSTLKRYALGDTPPPQSMPMMPKKVFVVDGLNIIRSYSQKSGAVSFEAFLSLLSELMKRAATFFCVFDANTYYVLRDNAGSRVSSLFRRLLDSMQAGAGFKTGVVVAFYG